MKRPAIIAISMLLYCTSLKGQTLNPMELYMMKEIAKSNSLPLIGYTVYSLADHDFNLIDKKSHVDEDDNVQTVYKFTNGKDETIIITNIFGKDKSQYGMVEYQLYNNSLFEQFKKDMQQIKMGIDASEVANNGTPFWLWKFTDPNTQLDMPFSILAVFKEKWGYKILLN